MISHHRLFRWRLPAALLAIFLSAVACAAPMAAGNTPPAVTNVPGATAAFLPTATRPAVPTQPSAPTATTIPAAAVPTNTKAPVQLSEVTIYFIAVGDNGQSGIKVGCGDSLVAVKESIEPTSGVIRASLNRLFSFKQQNVGQSGLYNALWQSNLTLASAQVDDGVATVSLTGTVQMGGECDTPRFKGQIEQTILAQPGVKQAIVFLNGKPIDQALSLK